MNVLVTGASGFVGAAVCAQLSRRFKVSAATRSATTAAASYAAIAVGTTNHATDWGAALRGQDVVIHLVARVHVMKDLSRDPLAEFRAVNVAGSLNLARQAAEAGVKRMIFVSSVKVNGEYSLSGQPFTEESVPAPADFYGVSKLEAEIALRSLAQETGMELVIIRPPLVYGPGVKANFAALVRAVKAGWPLPLAKVNNQRSLVGLDNLVSFIETCTLHPDAAGQTFLVSDGQDLSTPELIRRIAQAAQVPARLLPIPVWFLEAGASLLGKREAVRRLCGNLQVDIAKARDLLGWSPPCSMDEGLRRTVAGSVKA